jgi:hypothetical protein
MVNSNHKVQAVEFKHLYCSEITVIPCIRDRSISLAQQNIKLVNFQVSVLYVDVICDENEFSSSAYKNTRCDSLVNI